MRPADPIFSNAVVYISIFPTVFLVRSYIRRHHAHGSLAAGKSCISRPIPTGVISGYQCTWFPLTISCEHWSQAYPGIILHLSFPSKVGHLYNSLPSGFPTGAQPKFSSVEYLFTYRVQTLTSCEVRICTWWL